MEMTELATAICAPVAITAQERERSKMNKVWGYKEGDCAWCLDAPATQEYVGDQPSDMGKALYQVCQNCYEERE